MKLLVGKKFIATFGLVVLLLLTISTVSHGSVARLLAIAGWADQLIVVGDLLALVLVVLSGGAIYHDIVRRERAEAALAKERDLLWALMDSFPDQIYFKDTQGRFTRVNPVQARILGVDHPDRVVGTTDFDYYTPSIGIEARADEDRIIATGKALVGKVERQILAHPNQYDPTGEQNDGFFSTTKAPILDRQGQVIGIVGITHDITEQKRVEEALRAAEERFRTLVEQLPAITYVAALDADSSTLYTSPQIETMLGFSQAEWMADHDLWRKQIHPDDYTRVMADIALSQSNGAPVPSEYRMIARDGSARWFRDQAVIVYDSAGQPLFMQGIMFDITERKNIERMKNEFVATVSHELRTPLTAIRGSLGLIAGGIAGEVPAKVRTMVEIGYKNSERLIRLINDILDIEKIESGKMIFDLQPVELMPLLEHAIDINRAYGQQYDVAFALESAVAGAWVHADSDRLIQAVTNLLSNAAKFSPPGSRVLVSLARRGETLRIAIHDRGPGIPEAFRDRLFHKFAQANASNTRQKGGTGLGLSITKAIVEKLGGQIDVTTEPGVGSTFFIDLPEWRAMDRPVAGSPATYVLIHEPDHGED